MMHCKYCGQGTYYLGDDGPVCASCHLLKTLPIPADDPHSIAPVDAITIHLAGHGDYRVQTKTVVDGETRRILRIICLSCRLTVWPARMDAHPGFMGVVKN